MTRRRSTHWCGPECGYCQNRINQRESERDNPEPLGAMEEARMDDWAERAMEAMWP